MNSRAQFLNGSRSHGSRVTPARSEGLPSGCGLGVIVVVEVGSHVRANDFGLAAVHKVFEVVTNTLLHLFCC